jgi:hypothetical protein
MRRAVALFLALAVVVAVVVGALAVSLRSGRDGRAGGTRAETSGETAGEEPGSEGDAPEEEAAEHREGTADRVEALREAIAAGTFGKRQAIAAAPAAGWSGETVVGATKDDWEPAIAADPSAPYVYLLTTRYGEPKPCPGNCPAPFIALLISSNGGQTWAPAKPLCACKGSGQFDPIIEVVPNTGAVYAAYLNGFNVMFVKSTDHGATWSAPVPTYGNVSWNDKPTLAMSNDGRDVYVSWNGPTGGDPYVAQSHDFGATWTQTKIVNSDRYYFTFDADVLPNGEVVFAEGSVDYSSTSGQSGTIGGVIEHDVFLSTNAGASWTVVPVDTVEVGEPCIADGCTPDFYIDHQAVSADATGNLVFLYDGATVPQGPQQIFARRSTDGGFRWSARVPLSTAGEEASMPSVEQTGTGNVRAFYSQTANGNNQDVWNVWYRTSTDGGITWAAPVRISDATSGAGYKTAAGFMEPYGDYGEIAVTNTGKTIATWGEGFSYNGPGGVWVNRQT